MIDLSPTSKVHIPITKALIEQNGCGVPLRGQLQLTIVADDNYADQIEIEIWQEDPVGNDGFRQIENLHIDTVIDADDNSMSLLLSGKGIIGNRQILAKVPLPYKWRASNE